jgi:hypothetical protein
MFHVCSLCLFVMLCMLPIYRFNRYKSIDGSGGFGRGSIGDSDENKHEASSEEQHFYKEVNINK